MWDTFCTLPESASCDCKAVAFEGYLKKEIAKMVQAEKSVLGDENEIKIANISFAFDNHEVLALFKKRGTLIAAGKANTVGKIDDRINYLKNM